MDQFAAMRAFVKVVETDGFSEASRQLQMAVSSVTRQVKCSGRNAQYLTDQLAALPSRRKVANTTTRQFVSLQDVEETNV